MTEYRGGSGNFTKDRERASSTDRKNGQYNGGSFKNDPQRTSEADKKGSQQGDNNKSGKS